MAINNAVDIDNHGLHLTGRRRAILVSCLAAYSLSNLLLYLMSPFFQVYAEKEAGASTFTVGLVFAVMPYASFLFAVPSGKLVDKFGAKPTLILGLCVLGVSTALFGASGTVKEWFLWRGIQGAATGPIFNAVNTILARTFCGPGEFNTVNGWLQSLGNAGFAVGPIVGGVLFEYGGFQAPFFASAVVLGFFVLLSPLIPGSTSSSHAGAGPAAYKASSSGSGLLSSQLLSSKTKVIEEVGLGDVLFGRVLWMTGGCLLVPAVTGVLDPVLVSHLRASLGVQKESQLGVLIFLSAFPSAIGALAVAYVEQYVSLVKIVAGGLLTVAACLGVLALDPRSLQAWDMDFAALEAGSPLQWVLQLSALVGIGFFTGLAWTAILPEMVDHASKQIALQRDEPEPAVHAVSAPISALFNTGVGIGEAMGPAVGCAVITIIGWGDAILGFAVLIVCFSTAMLLFTHGGEMDEQVEEEHSLALPGLLRAPTMRAGSYLHLGEQPKLTRQATCAALGKVRVVVKKGVIPLLRLRALQLNPEAGLAKVKHVEFGRRGSWNFEHMEPLDAEALDEPKAKVAPSKTLVLDTGAA